VVSVNLVNSLPSSVVESSSVTISTSWPIGFKLWIFKASASRPPHLQITTHKILIHRFPLSLLDLSQSPLPSRPHLQNLLTLPLHIISPSPFPLLPHTIFLPISPTLYIYMPIICPYSCYISLHCTISRSTQPCIPPGSLNRLPASAGVRAGMSPLPGGR